MYAIVDIAGQQFKVEKDQKLYVHRLDEKEGEKVAFDRVMLIEKDDKFTVGSPLISGAAVSATVIDQVKGDKVLVFKKKRRKGYKKLTGHRQQFTQIQITDIIEKGAKAASAKKVSADSKESKTEKPAASGATAEKKSAATSGSPKKPATARAAAEKKTASAAEKKKAAPKPAAEKKKAAPRPAAEKKAASTSGTAKKPAASKTAGEKKEAGEKKTAQKKAAAPAKKAAPKSSTKDDAGEKKDKDEK